MSETVRKVRGLAIECKENYDKEEWLEKFIYAVCEQIIEPLQEKIKDFILLHHACAVHKQRALSEVF